jgi:hypothetical protein
MINEVRKFIAERLRDEDLYKKVLETLQYVLDDAEVGYKDIIEKYNDPSQLDPEATKAILEEFGYSYIADIFTLFESQDLVELIRYLNFISLMKGHRDGLEVIFEFLSLDYKITEWWEYQNGEDVSYGEIGLVPFGYAIKNYNNLDDSMYLKVIENSYITNVSNATIGIWYRYNIATLAPRDEYILSDDTTSTHVAINANGDLEFFGNGYNLFTGLNLLDGQWHYISYTVLGHNLNNVFVDGVELPLQQIIYGFNPTKYVMGFMGLDGFGAYGNIAQLTVYNEVFNLAKHTEAYNNGEPLNPFNHSSSSNLAINFNFGDNLFDNTEYDGATTFFDNVSDYKISLFTAGDVKLINTSKVLPIIGNAVEFLIPHEWKLTINLLASAYTVDIAKSAESLLQFTRNYVYPVLRWLDLIYDSEFGTYQLISHGALDKIHRLSYVELFKTITIKSVMDKKILFTADQDALEFVGLFDNNLVLENGFAILHENFDYLKTEDY